MHKKTDNFIKLPEYPGGTEHFKDFVKNNLKYPKEALEQRIEGIVILNAEITDRGVVQDIKVEKGLGFGCDDEAKRVLGLAKFGSVKNRGLKVKTRKTFKIGFCLPKNVSQVINYQLKEKDNIAPKNTTVSYSYTISVDYSGNP
jgi:TonB family protein